MASFDLTVVENGDRILWWFLLLDLGIETGICNQKCLLHWRPCPEAEPEGVAHFSQLRRSDFNWCCESGEDWSFAGRQNCSEIECRVSGECRSARDLEQHQYLKGGQRNPKKRIYRQGSIEGGVYPRGIVRMSTCSDCPAVSACRTPGCGGPSAFKYNVPLVRPDQLRGQIPIHLGWEVVEVTLLSTAELWGRE